MLLLKASRSVRILWHRHDLHSEELWKGWGADVCRLRPQPDHLRLRHQPVGDHQAERHRELHASSDESIAGVNGHRHKCVDSLQRLKKVRSLKLLIRSSTSTPGVQTNRSTKWQQRSLVAAMNNSPAGGTCHHSIFISFEFWENILKNDFLSPGRDSVWRWSRGVTGWSTVEIRATRSFENLNHHQVSLIYMSLSSFPRWDAASWWSSPPTIVWSRPHLSTAPRRSSGSPSPSTPSCRSTRLYLRTSKQYSSSDWWDRRNVLCLVQSRRRLDRPAPGLQEPQAEHRPQRALRGRDRRHLDSTDCLLQHEGQGGVGGGRENHPQRHPWRRVQVRENGPDNVREHLHVPGRGEQLEVVEDARHKVLVPVRHGLVSFWHPDLHNGHCSEHRPGGILIWWKYKSGRHVGMLFRMLYLI